MATPGDVGPCGEPGCGRPRLPAVCRGLAAGELSPTWSWAAKEALNCRGDLEPLHDPLSSSGRLIGVFGPVIEGLGLPCLQPRGMISRLAAA